MEHHFHPSKRTLAAGAVGDYCRVVLSGPDDGADFDTWLEQTVGTYWSSAVQDLVQRHGMSSEDAEAYMQSVYPDEWLDYL
jgi:hypothetical protein